MIGKIGRGSDTAGLLRYLFGPGRANEHTDPHLVAAWDDTALRGPREVDRARLKALAGLLDQPLALLPERPETFVWHASLRAAPEDRRLTDAEWADVARDVLHRTGLAPRDDSDGCRWVAVRHADDHIHLAVTLVRQDGRRARASHDFARVGAACREAEVRYGLTRTAPRDGTAARRPTRAEIEKTRRAGGERTPREQLRQQVRRAALSSRNLDGFVEQLRGRGVEVRLRHSSTRPDLVTGYAVAVSGDRTAGGEPIWYGGGKLAPYLSLPRVASTWNEEGQESADAPGRTLAPHVARRPHGTLVDGLRSAAAIAAQVERGDALAAATAVLKAVTPPRYFRPA